MDWKEFHRLLKRMSDAEIEKKKAETQKSFTVQKIKARNESFTASADLFAFIRRNLAELIKETEGKK